MKKTCALLLGLAAISGVSPADAAKKAATSAAAPQSLEAVNQALLGRAATIRLFEGEIVRGAKGVRIESEFTHWDGAKGPRRMATSEVEQVSIQGRFPILRSAAMGLAAGTLIGLVAAGSAGDTGTPVDAAVGASVLGGSMLGGAAIGGVVGTTTAKNRGRVVYKAPFDRYLNDS